MNPSYVQIGMQRWAACAAAGLALLLVLLCMPLACRAQPARDLADEASRERLLQWRRDLNAQAPVWGAAARQGWADPLADESPCFPINRVVLESDDADTGRWRTLTQDLGRFVDACLGPRSIERLRNNLAGRLADQGWLTSRVSVPEQSLAGGVLRLALQTGRVEAVLVEPPADVQGPLPAPNALAFELMQPLNLRAIEQTLENLARLPSQAALFRIEPGARPGDSRIVISPAGGPRWRGSLGLESTETADYGPWQMQASLSVDAPLGISDQLGLVGALGRRHDGAEQPRQASWLLNYSVPLGHQLLTVSLSRAEFRRFIQGGVGRFAEQGDDTQLQARWQWTAWRSQTKRLALWAGASAQRVRANIDGSELLLRRRDSSSLDLGLAWQQRHACGDAGAELALQRTVWLAHDANFQTQRQARPSAWRLQLQASCSLGHHDSVADAISGPGAAPWQLSVRLAAQGVRHPVGSADLASIGSRWTVRGHAAGQSLAGQGATVLRLELLAPPWAALPSAGLRALAALDHGRIHQPLGGNTARRDLTGLALGARGQWGAWTGEWVLAWPLRAAAQPQTEPSGRVLYGSLNFNF